MLSFASWCSILANFERDSLLFVNVRLQSYAKLRVGASSNSKRSRQTKRSGDVIKMSTCGKFAIIDTCKRTSIPKVTYFNKKVRLIIQNLKKITHCMPRWTEGTVRQLTAQSTLILRVPFSRSRWTIRRISNILIYFITEDSD